MPEVVLLKSMDRHVDRNSVKQRVETALRYFPELQDETIYIGILRENDYVDGKVNSLNRILLFRPSKVPTYVTVFHELMHLAIAKVNENGEKLPKTEEFCSISAMARMPPEFVDEKSIPYVGRPVSVSLIDVPELCKMALQYRKRRRDYIRWLRRRIKGGD